MPDTRSTPTPAGRETEPAQTPARLAILKFTTPKLSTEEVPMPRIIVTADPVSSRVTETTPVLLDEQVRSVHLSTGHAAAQLVERLAWAVSDAERAEDTGRDTLR